MKLAAKVRIPFCRDPFVVLIEDGTGEWQAPIAHRAIIAEKAEPTDLCPTVFRRPGCEPGMQAITLPPELDYLATGDIVRVNPAAQELRVIYRRNSRHNGLLLTERCNSRCIMCSQPPRDVEDGFLVDELLEAIPLMSRSTPELGFSGGEPTLLGDGLIDLIRCTKKNLPCTALHVLSNGRQLRFLGFASKIAEVGHPDLMLGVPLYSDIASKHDFVVQADGAFDETVLGLLNLARVGIRVEIRVVIHRRTFERLPNLARFITTNFPFVEQVALMGMEFMGYARSNAKALWIDPREYARELVSAVEILEGAGLTAKIYNHPHCLLPESLWPFTCQSISDWKNTYAEVCAGCGVQSRCSGFFESAPPWQKALANPRSTSVG